MYYEINVSKHGKHYFATHERSLRDIEIAHQLAQEFKLHFPESLGFKVTMTRWNCTGTPIDIG
jgi:hypothetical protein